MRRLTLALALTLVAALCSPLGAQAAFELKDLDLTFTGPDGSPVTQAGSRPFAVSASAGLQTTVDGEGTEFIDEEVKDLTIQLPPGFIGDATAVPRCSTADFLERENATPTCPNETAIGVIAVKIAFDPLIKAQSKLFFHVPVYNLQPPPGVPVRVGFAVLNLPVTADAGIRPEAPFNIESRAENISQAAMFYAFRISLWGQPDDPAHDPYRGNCVEVIDGSPVEEVISKGDCPVPPLAKPFLTTPRACEGALSTTFSADSWQKPGIWTEPIRVLTHDDGVPPQPIGFEGCGKLGFSPKVSSRVSTESAETGSGFDFDVDFHDEGLTNPDGLPQSEAKEAVVTLPEGVTINPSVGESLGVCTPADIDRETLRSAPGEGCPNASKLGILHIDTPLVDEGIDGSVFLAQQDDAATTTPGAENPFDSLIALYLVVKNTNLGVLIKLPLKVEADPSTGRLVATLKDIPQIPFSHFNFHFREGARAPLITPPACGTYTTKAVFTPWASPTEPVTSSSSFKITRGVNGGACPPGGVPPFHPDFEAGALNNNAGSFSPFYMRLIRKDGEQDMTKFSAVLPPGEVGSLVGVAKCPDSAVAIARSKTGRQELASPSCPASSEIGHTLAGAGVGEALTYVGGKIYLGGPHKGDPLSVIAITPAVAGPFDAGTVVVRLALTLNPKTAEVEVDGANSDPIPHIIKGIVLKVRDLRVYVDRPNFLLNPTSCDESSAKATLFGSYLDVLSPADDVPVSLSSRYQAAGCAGLGFKPKLNLKLKGGTKRGGHPGLKALYRPRAGDANVESLVVRLPRSAFLDQAHIRTICTRVQFAADNCPKGAQYGYIKAFTPLLEEPLQGPVWLRSSNNKLPDLVFDLHGLVDVEVATRIDSAKGGIRATVQDAPDAPLSKVELRMQGGKKGLIINSRNLCGATSKANVQFDGHNGKRSIANPVMRPDGCGGKRKAKR